MRAALMVNFWRNVHGAENMKKIEKRKVALQRFRRWNREGDK